MKHALIVIVLALAFAGNAAPDERKAAARTHTVLITAFKFVPEALEVNAGDTVVWKNQDLVPHTATGKKFDSKGLDQGQNWSYVARTKGSFPYICYFHPTMKAQLTVK